MRPAAPYTIDVSRVFPLLLLICCLHPIAGQGASDKRNAGPAWTGQRLVDRALANELAAAEDHSHPMRYRLRKTTPRRTTTRQIVETRDGDVAKLVAIADQPLVPAAEAREEARLNSLLEDPAKQGWRKQAEDADTLRALKVLRALPRAFLYHDDGPGQEPAGPVEKFTFRPNPAYSPSSLETQVLPAMTGEIWIDPLHLRVVWLQARIERDVNFGWGILGRLDRGGWIAIQQANVGEDQWRTVRFQMRMTGRVLFKTRVFDTTEEQTQFAPVPAGIGYRDAVAMLLAGR